jgi:hypothetical protein
MAMSRSADGTAGTLQRVARDVEFSGARDSKASWTTPAPDQHLSEMIAVT